MTQAAFLLLFCTLLFAQSLAWFSASPCRFLVEHRSSIVVLRAGDDDNEEAVSRPGTTMNPCWQSFLDDDCNMSTMYASSFVAGKWIKSMPCGEGIEDCDMPTALMTPDTYPESGVVGVDVMDFLHLKRATSLKKP